MPDTITLQLLGTPTLRLGNGTPVELRQKAYAVAALLYLEYRDRARRSVVAQQIWEASKLEQAMTNLRQTLLHTRNLERDLGFELFISDTTYIELSRAIVLDLREIGRLRTVNEPAELERLIGLYRGDLLDGASDFAPEFGQWLSMMRTQVEEQFITQATEAAARIGGPAGRAALAQLSAQLPLSDAIARAQIDALMRDGQMQQARTVFDAYRQRVRRDLGNEPSEELTALISPPARTSTQGRSVPAAPVTPIHPERRPAFIPRVVLLPPMQEQKHGALPKHLAPALIEDVTIRLTRLKSVSVIAPHTAWQIDPFSALDEVRAHQIDYAVESRVAPEFNSDRMSIAIRLVRASGREIVWADKFSFSPGETPALYWDFANGIARSLADNIEAAELASQRGAREANPDAYGHYLSGRHHLRTFDLPQVRRGRRDLRLARDIDPEQASIESALARTYVVEWVLRSGSDGALLDRARLHAERAVDIDPNDGTAYRELGRAALFDGHLDMSLEYMSRAAELTPHHADVLADYADTLAHNSNFDAARDKIDLAMQLNPMPPDEYLWTQGGISFFHGQWELALSQLSRMRNTDPALRLMAATAAMAGHRDLAVKYRQQALELQPDFTIARWISKMPQRDPADVDLYIEALRRAGFQ